MASVLKPDQIVTTVQTLQWRIGERFPGSGLEGVAGELLSVARSANDVCRWIATPLWAWRLIVGTVSVAALGLLVAAIVTAKLPRSVPELGELVQLLEPAMNIVIIVGAAIFFLLTVETRVKRRRALKAIHELRALAHVIDMHQLTKDPDKLVVENKDTASSPRHEMTPFEMSRYLDYCSEMLALIGKIGALYSQTIEDSVALDAIDDIESLTMGLSRKIWQKMTMLNLAEGTTRP